MLRDLHNLGLVRIDLSSGKTVVYGHETILLVEDEKNILEMTCKMLQRMGYRVLPAPTPGKALKISDASDTQGIDLLMTDVVMPEMNGRDLAGKILQSHPDCRCLFMSGYTANVIARHGVLDKGVHFLSKPFSLQTLSTKVREALGDTGGDHCNLG